VTARLMTETEAAEYLSLPVASVKKLAVGRVRLGSRTRFDRRALDAHLDALSGLSTPTLSDDDMDAEFDRFAATLNRPARHP
jgi:predicted component of type VI protein secretion system